MSEDRPTGATVDVLIAGGGLVGLTLARALGTAGLRVVVVDRERPAAAAADTFDGRGSAIAWGSAQALTGLGLWAALAPHAQPIRDIRVSDGASLLFLHYDHRETGIQANGAAAPLGYIVENRFLRRALYEAVAATPNVELIAPGELVALDRHSGFVDARLGDGRELRASLAIACDGRESPLRGAAGISVVRWNYPQTGIVASIAHALPHDGVA